MNANLTTKTLSFTDLDLIRRAEPRLRKLAVKIARAACADRDDLYQVGLEVAARRLRRFKPEKGMTFYAYIYPAARAAMLDACKRERRAREIQEDDSGLASTLHCTAHTPEDAYLDAEERARVHEIIATLDDVDREIVMRCALGGEPIAEAARLVGLEYDRARYRLGAATKVLLRRLRASR